MSHHGSHRSGAERIKYDAKDLKIIKAVWQGAFGTDFKPDQKVELPDMIRRLITDFDYDRASTALGQQDNFKGYEVYFVSPSGSRQPVEIPGRLRPLRVLAMYKADNCFSEQGGKVYIPPLQQ